MERSTASWKTPGTRPTGAGRRGSPGVTSLNPHPCPQARRTRAAVLALGFAVACALALGGCSRSAEVEGHSRVPMARKTVEDFLAALCSGSYSEAARLFAGPVAWLQPQGAEAVPSISTPGRGPGRSAIANLLARYVAAGAICCGASVDSVRILDPFQFQVWVRFPGSADGAARPVEFRVTFDGTLYRVLGLPPLRRAPDSPRT